MKRLPESLRMVEPLVRVLLLLPVVEVGRRRTGPKALLERFRRRGERADVRDAASRVRLMRAIFWVDRHMPGGANCYRRTLLEIALDRHAAAQPFRMGFRTVDG